MSDSVRPAGSSKRGATRGFRAPLGLAGLALALVLGGSALLAWRRPPVAGAAGSSSAVVQAATSPSNPASEATQRPRTVILVRHAEKDPQGDARDPGLSEAGRKRALALQKLLGSAGVTHLFSSEYQRTRQTLEPLAKELGLEVRALPAAKPEELIAALAALPAGSVSVVAGHSNTVPDLVQRLGGVIPGLTDGAKARSLPEDRFDRLFVVSGSGAGASALQLVYGD